MFNGLRSALKMGSQTNKVLFASTDAYIYSLATFTFASKEIIPDNRFSQALDQGDAAAVLEEALEEALGILQSIADILDLKQGVREITSTTPEQKQEVLS